MSVLRLRALEQLVEDPSVLFARRAVAFMAGLLLWGVAIFLGLALATWTVSDPSLTHATASPVRNWMGAPGAAMADPIMQLFGLAAPLLLAPFALWGTRLMAGRPLGIGPDRALPGIAALLLAPGFFNAFPVTSAWPLPLGLGGVLGEFWGELPVALFGATSGFARGIFGGILGLGAAFALYRAVSPPRIPLRETQLGFQIKRSAPADDEYGLDETDAYETEPSRLDIWRGALAHAVLSVRARLRRPDLPTHRTAPHLSDALSRTMDDDEHDASVYRARSHQPHPQSAAPEPAAAYHRADGPPPQERIVREQRAAAAPPAARPAPPAAPVERSTHSYMAPLRGPAARLRDQMEAEPEPLDAEPMADAESEMAYVDEAPVEEFADDEGEFLEDDPGALPLDVFEDGTDEEDPFEAEVARRQSPAPMPAGRVAAPVGAVTPGRRVVREAQPSLLGGEEYEFPPIALLAAPPADGVDTELTEDALEANARVLEGVLEDFGVRGSIVHVRPGPVVTLYELEPAPGIKSSRVIGLADDIARSMSAISARVAVIPGKNAIGIELPNRKRITVYLRELLASRDFERTKAKLPMCLGKTIGGEAVIADLARMPHLLVAGTTGSGKSVSVNTMILSLLYWHKPERCRVILIDPKMLELSVYDGIPHLLTEVVTDPKKAVSALKWAVREMEDRYRKMAKLGVRNIDGYNARLKEAGGNGEPLTRIVQTGFDKRTGEAIFEEEVLDLDPMPYIVVIVDEMADLMMVAGKEIEGAIQRLAQMARAAGIHLIMATQRPSVDVITGTIKANFPTRISFQVTSKIDSRTILGEMGAEQLLGMGDMLFMAGGGRIQRVHGPFVADEEVEDVVAHLKRQGMPEYLAEVLDTEEDEDVSATTSGLEGLSESEDLYDRAVALVLRDRKASTSYVQRRLSIGYNRAATLIERMEKEGVVSPSNHAGKREILVPAEEETA